MREVLALGRRLAAGDGAGRVDGVLALDRLDDLADRDVELRELVKLDPVPDRILAGPEDGRARDPGHARQLVEYVDVGVVREEGAVVRVGPEK